jgi:hypothetical protein
VTSFSYKYQDTNTMFLDIIHRPVEKHNISNVQSSQTFRS